MRLSQQVESSLTRLRKRKLRFNRPYASHSAKSSRSDLQCPGKRGGPKKTTGRLWDSSIESAGPWPPTAPSRRACFTVKLWNIACWLPRFPGTEVKWRIPGGFKARFDLHFELRNRPVSRSRNPTSKQWSRRSARMALNNPPTFHQPAGIGGQRSDQLISSRLGGSSSSKYLQIRARQLQPLRDYLSQRDTSNHARAVDILRYKTEISL